MIHLSIIIPVYNVERYLPMCLDSVVKQSLSDYEVILVDDCSTDGSGRICDEFAAKYPEFSVIHQENQGVSAARNQGMKEAKGNYILFLDSDDFLVAGSLQSVLRMAENNNLDVMGFGIRHVPDESKDFLNQTDIIPQTVEVITGVEYISRHAYEAQVWWYIVSRSLLIDNQIEFPIGHMLEDAAFNIRVFTKACRMAQIPNAIYCYRDRSESIMRNKDIKHQKRLMYDYIYAAKDVGDVLDSVQSEMDEAGYVRCRSRRDSYVFFGAIRAFKLGLVNEYITEAKSQGLYPFERMSKTDYPGLNITLSHWCISHPIILKFMSFFYRFIR